MDERAYSSGLMSHSFWFHEFRLAVKLRANGLGYDEIKKRCIEENLVGAVKEYRALRITNYIIARVKMVLCQDLVQVKMRFSSS